MPLSRKVIATSSICSALVLAGCGGNDYSAAESYVGAALEERASNASYLRYYQSVTDLLDNVRYQVGPLEARALTDAVVVADVKDVQPGRSFKVAGADAPGGTETDFDDPDTEWFTVHVTADVQEIVSGRVESETVRVGFAFSAGTTFESIAQDFLDMPNLLLFLTRSDVFAYDDQLYAAIDGFLYAVVGEDGKLTFPSLTASDVDGLEAKGLTLDDVRAAAEQPSRTVHIDAGAVR